MLVQGGGRPVCHPNCGRSEGEGASTRTNERTHASKHTQTASWDISVGWAKAWARRLGGSGECQDRRAKRLLGNDRMGMVAMATQLAQAVRGNR